MVAITLVLPTVRLKHGCKRRWHIACVCFAHGPRLPLFVVFTVEKRRLLTVVEQTPGRGECFTCQLFFFRRVYDKPGYRA